MKLFRQRRLMVATSVSVATLAIGIPTAIVFANKENNKEDISLNITSDVENQILSSVDLMPANRTGTFNKARLKGHVDKLNSLKAEIKRLSKEYSAFAKTKMPYYGIVNDVLNVADRFEDWESFVHVVYKVKTDINKGDWKTLKKDLFDEENNGKHKLLSKSYGVKRSELADKNGDIYGRRTDDGKLVKDDIASYTIQHEFISFDEYVESLILGFEDTTPKKDIIKMIVSVLNMMTGTPMKFGSDNKIQNFDLMTEKPKNSIVYFLKTMDSNTDADSKKAMEIWHNEYMVAWKNRYDGLASYLSPENEPIGTNGQYDSMFNLDAFKLYETSIYKAKKTGDDIKLPNLIEGFLGGKPMQDISYVNGLAKYVVDEKAIKGSAGRYLTNWEFMRMFFGNEIESIIDSPGHRVLAPAHLDTGDISDKKINGQHLIRTEPSKQPFDGFSKIKDTTTSAIGGVGHQGSLESPNPTEYWKNVIDNIFNSDFINNEDTSFTMVTLDKDNNPIFDAKDSLWREFVNDKSFYQSYQYLMDAQEEYNEEIHKINKDPFRMGIDLNKIDEIQSKYQIKNDWSILIDSFDQKVINADALNEIKSKLVLNKKGDAYEEHTKDYDIFNGFVFPIGPKWLIRSSDKLSISNMHFKDSAKLSKYNDAFANIRLFEPIYDIDDEQDAVSVEVRWNSLGEIKKGGDNA